MLNKTLDKRSDAYALLHALGASARLLRHLQLVGEAADALIDIYNSLALRFDARLIELGAAVHDAGKIVFPEELDGPGARHEAAGQALMLANGVPPAVARCFVSHAAWQEPGNSFEELSVALADKLWKGKREEELELRVIDMIAAQRGQLRWDVFTTLDSAFEDIAAGGGERLRRSIV
ncbi:phosphohydrolase [Massilia genomosp. 1]|uniref:Phosphohydrolase n=1 Tax=Massilia genomosp. 1 TaxID=2609280 RepID=A0ABX0MNG3_9BURK|nr:phosphohydrolase [Massilia genomosp. 1]NHZ62140.1 phosphohydrolase [Massilia genomosp. 1]